MQIVKYPTRTENGYTIVTYDQGHSYVVYKGNTAVWDGYNLDKMIKWCKSQPAA